MQSHDMNIDRILRAFNAHQVKYMLIGGVNFLLRHAPILTYDVDIWIEDSQENRPRCETALAELEAEWGVSDEDWAPVATRKPGWLSRQALYCLNSPHGAIDVFRSVTGLPDWRASFEQAVLLKTTEAGPVYGLCDEDMLQCQLALAQPDQKQPRINALREAIENQNDGSNT